MDCDCSVGFSLEILAWVRHEALTLTQPTALKYRPRPPCKIGVIRLGTFSLTASHRYGTLSFQDTKIKTEAVVGLQAGITLQI